MKLLEEKVAVVTGGAQGLGLAIAKLFADHGARVMIGDLNIDAAEREAAALDGAAQRCNVTEEHDIDNLLRSTAVQFGSVDIMVNNAGITRDKTMGKMTPEDFRKVIDVHLYGAWLGTRAASAIMREQGSGSIINMSSISGKVGNFGQTNYSAAKAGMVGLTKAAAKEVAAKGVRVNAIQPGLIRTAMTESMPKDAWDAKLAEIPMRRPGEPAEVASTALFLASDLSSYITGVVIEVAGGRHI